MPYDIKTTPDAERALWPALMRGWRQTCPCCGTTRLYAAFLKVEPVCKSCRTELHHQRADDAPPYFTMFIVGHVVVAGLLFVERKYQPEIWLHLAIWLPLTVGLSLWLLPRIKGAFIAQQWALRMHGFGTPVTGIDSVETWSGDEVAAKPATEGKR
jgi:uncharacterized protein (DUF983 family)